MKKIMLLILLTFYSVFCFANLEEKYYKATYKNISYENLVTTYGANGEDELDDSIFLQNAINDISLHPKGGIIFIPFGRYYLANIEMKSNVHIEIEAGTSIVPTKVNPWKSYSIFNFDSSLGAVKNVSIRGIDGKFNVNLAKAKNKNVTVFKLRNVKNFKIENFMIHDNYTKLPTISLEASELKGKYFSPQNGVIKNGTMFKGHYGYGLVHIQTGKNIYLENLNGQGGVTLRLESSSKKLNSLKGQRIDGVYAKNISCTDGNAAVIISPHSKKNGKFTIDEVYSAGCGFAVKITKGYVKKEFRRSKLKPGSFAKGSSISNVLAIYGTRAQIKTTHFNYIPVSLRKLVAKETNIDGESYSGPSIAPVLNETMSGEKGSYKVILKNIKSSGFAQQSKLIINESDY